MRSVFVFCLVLVTALCMVSVREVGAQTSRRPQLCVTTDIGGDPDDTQSLVRLLVYSNQFQIQCLIATSAGLPGQLKVPETHPELIRKAISAYGEVRNNLMIHEVGWPTAGALMDKVKVGNRMRGADHIGEGNDTEAARWIIQKIDASTPSNPLNIAIWGGQTDVAQALWRVKHDRTPEQFRAFSGKLRIFAVGDQDHLDEWLHREFPGLSVISSNAPAGKDARESSYRGMYLGGDESLTSREWIMRSRFDESILGRLYPRETWTSPNPYGAMKEGDTISWFFFLPLGHNDPRDPSKPGWGGQFEKMSDGWWHDVPDDPRSTVSKWRSEFQDNFARRMLWTIH